MERFYFWILIVAGTTFMTLLLGHMWALGLFSGWFLYPIIIDYYFGQITGTDTQADTTRLADRVRDSEETK